MPKTEHKEIERSPVIVIMGHIDHGKSTLLDYIRKTNVVDDEVGGITQKMSAYEVIHKTPAGKENRITFLDTPGHEAFGKVRMCGARVADIAVLVVSAEDGVKQQTLDALKCIKESKIPYIVAINKIDKPTANVERTKQSLAENEIYLEGYGGNVPTVSISAKIGTGVSELLDLMLLVAEMEQFKGDPKKPAEGFIIESHLDKLKGVSATLVIKNGTIENGDFVVSGESIAPVRMMEDFRGKKIKSATFSTPIKIIGWDKLPKVDSPFITYKDRKLALEKVEQNKEKLKKVVNQVDTTDENIAIIPIIIKANISGMIGAIEHEIEKIKNDRVQLKFVSTGVGDITENDIKLASGKEGTIVIGFDNKIDPQAKALGEKFGIELGMFNIIYKMTEWLEPIIKSRILLKDVEEQIGLAKIQKVFSVNKSKQVVGGKVEMGQISTENNVKILRRDVEIGKGIIKELQKQKSKTTTVDEGSEFGMLIDAKVEIAPGDKIQAYKIVKK
ncbi:translation initiation factor IF-2 [Candidatus Nomurabacteria bacterium]|nr:translation initiation factor IF-2 [Candidatus Nomurabacteria bacterium]